MALPKIEAPKYELTIPSTSEAVTYRPYLVKEEKILMMAMESDDDRQMARALKDVVASCVDFGDDPSKINGLAMFDLEYIFSKLRSKSVGESTEVGITCTECGAKNKVEINLEDTYVPMTDTADTQNIQITNSIVVRMMFPSLDMVLKTQEKDKGKGKSKMDEVLNLIIACIDKIYFGEDVYDAKQQSHQDMMEFVESLNSDQLGRIQKFIEGMPQTSLDVSFVCQSCQKANEFTLKGLSNFFG